MLIHKDRLRQALLLVLRQRVDQGCALDLAVYGARIEDACGSYDALYKLAEELRSPPLRQDWPYVEPVAWDDIVTESTALNPLKHWLPPNLAQAEGQARTGFLGSVCGCVLGKPVEIDPTLAELKTAAEAVNEWPLRNYISEGLLDRLGRRHASWAECVRGRIEAVVADDDIHYTLLGMLLLESHGPGFEHDDIWRLWEVNIPPGWSWGAERTALLCVGINRHHLFSAAGDGMAHDVLFLNPGDEMCGALIRADAFGYACPGNPDLAAWLAWKDASFTHIKTGVYGSMFVAALIALCHDADAGLSGQQRLQIAVEALKRVPAKTRFAAVVTDVLDSLSAVSDWESGYEAVHGKYVQYSHCQVYQEIGTLLNTLKFADSVDHGICIQVSQGSDTDSFGATAGSMLGVLMGPGYLDQRWLEPFNNEIRQSLGDFHGQDLDKLSRRIARLPRAMYGAVRDGVLADAITRG